MYVLVWQGGKSTQLSQLSRVSVTTTSHDMNREHFAGTGPLVCVNGKTLSTARHLYYFFSYVVLVKYCNNGEQIPTLNIHVDANPTPKFRGIFVV
jgi:hypothetical protein